MNWYEGSNQAWGRFRSPRATALLGFDNDIHSYCRGGCDNANVNILNLFRGNVKYNTCRNFEWQARHLGVDWCTRYTCDTCHSWNTCHPCYISSSCYFLLQLRVAGVRGQGPAARAGIARH